MRLLFNFLEWGIDLLIQGLEKGVTWLFEKAIPSALPTKPAGYQADFGSSKGLLKKQHTGFCLTGTHSLSKDLSYRNALVVGGTGTGKSSVVLLPSLLRMEGSFIVHDPSGELYQHSAGYLKSQGYDLRTLNFSNARSSDRFNPIARMKSKGEINQVASQIVRISLGGAKADPFWNLQATNLLGFLITLEKQVEKDRAHLGMIFQRSKTLLAKLKRWEAPSQSYGLEEEFQAFKGLDDRVKSGVIATLQSALQIFSDDQVVRVTESDTISFEGFRERKTALFIQNPVVDQAYYTLLSSLFFEQLFGSLLRRVPRPTQQDVFCLIDEAGVLNIPSLSSTIANIRKYRAGILLALQDPAQLLEFYGPAATEAIKTNCYTKLYFSGQTGRTGEELEHILGKYEYTGQDGRQYIRPLMTRDELRTMEKDKALLLLGHHHPMLLTLTPYYKNRALRKLTQLSTQP